MAFRVKDLMISIIPKEGDEPHALDCPDNTALCGPGSHTTQNLYGLFGAGPHVVCNAWRHHPTYALCGCPLVFCPGFSHLPPPSQYCCHPQSGVAGVVPVAFAGDPELAAKQLAAVKAQLKDAISEIEAQEKIVADRLQPQSDAEIGELLTKLKEAQTDLEKKKAQPKKP